MTCIHDMHPRHASTTHAHDMHPRHPRTTCIHDTLARHASTTHTDGWTRKLPTWAGKDRNRGLSSWGERVTRDKETHQPTRVRRWEITGICRAPVLSGVDIFAVCWAQPPVKTGHLPPSGHKFASAKKYGLGLNKNQLRLIPDDPETQTDIWSTFTFVVWIVYCSTLVPPVELGTEGAMAVFKVLTGEKCNKRLLLSLKTKLQVRFSAGNRSCVHLIVSKHNSFTNCLIIRSKSRPRHTPTTYTHDVHPRRTPTTHLQKWMNVASILPCVKPLNAWIHEGDEALTLQRDECLRTLGESSTPEEAKKCLSLVMQSLVDYSKGTGKQKVFPYERATGSSTTEFLNVSTGMLAATLSRMYPFAVNPQEEWVRLRKIRLYPYTYLWPKGVVKRFEHFSDTIFARYEDMKTAYEESGGSYHGDSDEEKEASVDPEEVEAKKGDVELACDKFF